MKLFSSLTALLKGRYSDADRKKVLERHSAIKGRNSGMMCANCGSNGSQRGQGVACKQCLSTSLC